MHARSLGLALLALALAPPLAHAGPYSSFVVFGDSLSDTGNAFIGSGGTYPPGPFYPPNTPYSAGRFSNGPIWVNTFASQLGLSSTAWLGGGRNYAFGGALTSGVSPYGTPSMAVQVGLYLGSGPSDIGTSLFSLWGGANDFFLGGQANPAVPANNIAAQIQTLINAGGREFLVFNLPALGDTPLGLGNTPFAGNNQFLLNLLTSLYNQQLWANLDQIEQNNPGVSIYRVDVAALFQQLLANPAGFGFNPALVGRGAVEDWVFYGAPFPTGNGYLFWDAVHPTTQVHSLIAQRALAAVPEPATLALFGVAAGALLLGRRRKAA